MGAIGAALSPAEFALNITEFILEYEKKAEGADISTFWNLICLTLISPFFSPTQTGKLLRWPCC